MDGKLLINVGKVCLCRENRGEEVHVAEVAKKYAVTEERLVEIINYFRESAWFFTSHRVCEGKGACVLENKI